MRTFATKGDLFAYLGMVTYDAEVFFALDRWFLTRWSHFSDDDGNVYILKLEVMDGQIHFNQLKRLGQVVPKAVVRTYGQFGVNMSWHPTVMSRGTL